VRIGVFGGSFDPIHLGHLIVAQHAADALELDQVRVLLAGEQPLKRGRHGASAAQRAAMLEAALVPHPRLTADFRETRRGGPSYTIDSLRELTAELPGDQLFLLLGADAAQDLPRWREAAEVARLATVVVLSRPGVPPPANPYVQRVLRVPAVRVSATDVRDAVRQGRPLGALVPPAVADYIAAHKLYHEDPC